MTGCTGCGQVETAAVSEAWLARHGDEGHTPGPWRVIGETDIVALEGTSRSIVVAATKFFEGPSTSWERANARLIAAAPELLATLKDVVAHLRSVTLDPGDDEDAPALVAAEALIAKAEGREP